MWPEEETDTHCANFFNELTCTRPGCPEGLVSSQQECQQRCIEKIGCVGISYSHEDDETSRYCYVCMDDNLIFAANNVGFYRRPGIVDA